MTAAIIRQTDGIIGPTGPWALFPFGLSMGSPWALPGPSQGFPWALPGPSLGLPGDGYREFPWAIY